MSVRSYAVVGVGGRGSGMFAQPLAAEFPATSRLVAVCDAANRSIATGKTVDVQRLLRGSAIRRIH